MIPYPLACVVLASRDPARTATVLRDILRLAEFRVPRPDGDPVSAFGTGETALVVLGAGDPYLSGTPAGIDHIALAADDPAAAADALGLPCSGVSASGLNGAKQVCVDPVSTCGVNVRFTVPLDLPPATADVVERIDHVGAASVDNERAEAVFVDRLGGVYESRQTDVHVMQPIETFTSDKYGIVVHSGRAAPVGGLRVSFVTVGDCDIEFLQDCDPARDLEASHGGPGNTKHDRSAIGRFIATRGPGLHHVALKCRDIDATLSRLAAAGCRLVDPAGRPGSRAARIGFVHPASTGGVLLHLVERDAVD